MSWKKRILRDLEDVRAGKFDVYGDTTEDITDLSCFKSVLQGPKDSLYEHASFVVRFTIPEAYPFKSPSVGFVTKIYHPNVDFASGTICLDALNSKWSPCFTIRHVLETLLPYLLNYPNPDDPLNREAAALLKSNPEDYAKEVRKCVQKYVQTT
jgi:ubiquitin-protein ligase